MIGEYGSWWDGFDRCNLNRLLYGVCDTRLSMLHVAMTQIVAIGYSLLYSVGYR